MSKLPFDKVDEIALCFAQALIATGAPVPNISDAAMNHALSWIDDESNRKKLYERRFPQWESLKDCKFEFLDNKKYWVAIVSKEDEKIEIEELEYNQYYYKGDDYAHVFTGKDGCAVNPQFFIKPENAKIFNENFKPFKPDLEKFEKRQNRTPISIPRLQSHWG